MKLRLFILAASALGTAAPAMAERLIGGQLEVC